MENFGIRLKNARKNLGLTQVEAAKLAGVTDKTWAAYEAEDAEPKASALERFADATGTDLLFLLTGKHPKKEESPFRDVPVIDRIPAGPLTQGFGEEGVLDYVQSSIADPHAFALLVTGTSMLPEIAENDIVLCSPAAPFINGKVYAAVIGEGEQSLKRVRHNQRSKAYALIPTNKEFPTLYVPEEQVIKLVRVVEVRRDLQ